MKRLRFQRITRLLLLLVLGSVALAIAWNLSARRQDDASASARDLLSQEVARRSVEFEHSEFRGGDLRFRVRAQTDTILATGEHALREVELLIYADGQQRDSVAGRRAVYRPDTKTVDFRESVQIKLADGTEVFSESLSASLEDQRIDIRRPFDYQRESLVGQGGALTYYTQARRLEVTDGFQLWLVDNRATGATSRRAVYRLDSGELELEGDVQAVDATRELRSQQLKLKLDGQSRVEHVAARGEASLKMPPQRVFKGAAIEFAFEPGLGRLVHFDVISSPQRRAQFADQSLENPHNLSAGHMRIEPSEEVEAGSRFISQCIADDNVILELPGRRLHNMRAQHLEAAFNRGGGLRELLLEGGAEVTGWEGEKLSSQRLNVVVDPQQQPLLIRAFSNVSASAPFGEGVRSFFTPNDLNMQFDEGILSAAECPLDCVLLTQSGVTTTRLESRQLKARFSSGLPLEVRAQGSVQVAQQDSQGRRLTRSQELVLGYREGRLARAVQRGKFLYRLESNGTSSTLRAEQAVYDPESQEILATGGTPVLVQQDEERARTVTTSAESFLLHRGEDRLEATGRVLSQVRGEGAPLEITAGKMEHSGQAWVEYRESPVLTEGKTRLAARRIRLFPEEDRLEALEGVDSQFQLAAEDGRVEEYQIQSRRMELLRSRQSAQYEGQVRARSEQLDLRSQHLRLDFAEADLQEVEKVTAWGEVQVKDGKRTAVGERSFYFPAEGRVQVLGNPAVLTDDKEGRVTGALLTFFTGDERLLVQNQASEDPP